MTHAQMNLIAELQSMASQVEDKGDHAVSGLLTRAHLALTDAQAEVARLTAELGDLPEAQADLLGQCKALTSERNAALARVAELENQEPIAQYAHYPERHMVGPDDGGMHILEALGDIPVGAKLYAAAGASPQPPQGLQAVADQLTIEQLNDKVTRLMASQPSQAVELSDDPLQGAVDWFLLADREFFCTATVQRTLRIGYNRAQRLCDIAKERAAINAKGATP